LSDAVILATGARPDRNAFPGGNGNVVGCLEVMEGAVDVGKRVVVAGSTGVAISTALFLVDRGNHDVAIVGPAKKFGLDVNPSYIWRYMKKVKEGGVKLYAKHEIKELRPDGVIAQNPEGEGVLIPADTIILANMTPRTELMYKKGDVYKIGDAVIPRRANGAIHDGYRLAMTL